MASSICLASFDASRLIRFIASSEHRVVGHPGAHKVDSVARANKNAHFAHTATRRFAIPEMAVFGAVQAAQDSRLSQSVRHITQLFIKLGRAVNVDFSLFDHSTGCSLLATPC
jgi:hypothetical protein